MHLRAENQRNTLPPTYNGHHVARGGVEVDVNTPRSPKRHTECREWGISFVIDRVILSEELYLGVLRAGSDDGCSELARVKRAYWAPSHTGGSVDKCGDPVCQVQLPYQPVR